jgi:uncharacterized protein YeaO (DUF488 family)
MIKTKSVYDPVEKTDGERILVTRYWPRGLSHKRLALTDRIKDLAPSIELLNDWKRSSITWQEYEKRYLEEMSTQTEKIEELAKRAKRGIITLLCIEPEDNPHCHRHLLKRLIESV